MLRPRLTRSLLKETALPPSVEVGSLDAFPERVLQFGEGNFLRAFLDWMIDRLNGAGLFKGRVLVVQPIEQGLVDALNEQEGLYTLILRGLERLRPVEVRRVITCVSRGLNPYTQWRQLLESAGNPSLRVVASNTTEIGIAYEPEERPAGVCPRSFPAKVAAWLFERFSHFGGAPNKGIIFLPCELIDQNGDALQRAILRHADRWGLGAEFVRWVESANIFLNTLVDRIVSGYPRQEGDAILGELGYEDRLLDAGEIYHLLVIEGPESAREILPFHEAGMNVVWTRDIEPYRTRKVAILNGAHTASVLAAYLAGIEIVRDMMEDGVFGPYVRALVFDEILPTIEMEIGEKRSFAEAVLERFRNPFMRHELLSISLNSVGKWRERVLPTLKKSLRKTGRPPRLLSFSLAALIAFYRGRLQGATLACMRGDREYLVRDQKEVLEFFAAEWKRSDVPVLVRATLAETRFWGEDLTKLGGLEDLVRGDLREILARGTLAAVRDLLP